MMTRIISAAVLSLGIASPALAAKGPFFSLGNSDFVVLIAFLLFLGVLFYFKVPTMIMGLLDKRADDISAEIQEAKALQEEAKSLLAEYERKQKDVQAQADRIVAQAKEDAQSAANQAKEDLKASIERRVTAAEEQIASAQSSAVKEVRDQAVTIAVAAARDVLAKQMTDASSKGLIDEAIGLVETKLH